MEVWGALLTESCMLQKTIMSTSGNVLGLILAAVAVIAMLLGVTMTQVWQHYLCMFIHAMGRSLQCRMMSACVRSDRMPALLHAAEQIRSYGLFPALTEMLGMYNGQNIQH
jgi:hypothetical protein